MPHKPGTNKKTSPAGISVEERREEAVRLRRNGLTYAQIGDQLGISKQTAFDDINAMLKKFGAEDVPELRALENERLTAVVAHAMTVLTGDYQIPERAPETVKEAADWLRRDNDERSKAGHLLVKTSERIAKLNGLDAPVTAHVTGDGTALTVMFPAALQPQPMQDDDVITTSD